MDADRAARWRGYVGMNLGGYFGMNLLWENGPGLVTEGMKSGILVHVQILTLN